MSTLVCGATGAIGAALARRIFSRGGTLVLAGRSESSLQSLSKELGNATYRVTDFSKPESVAASLGDLPEDLQGFAYAVGSITLKRITAAKPADYESSFALNVISASEAFKASMPGLKKNKGSAVFFSSVAASKGFASHAVVAASKGAIQGLTVSLAAELAPAIRVNCVAPSLTEGSAMSAPLLSNEKMASQMAAGHPMARLGSPEDSAAAADFLLSPDSTWITGQVLGCDGGRSTLVK